MNTTATNYARATIYTRSGLGGLVRTEVRDLTIETGYQYAQYKNAIRVQFTPKGKRKPRAMALTSYPCLIVIDGWGGPELSGHWQPEEVRTLATAIGTHTVTTRKAKYPSCDDRWEIDARAELAAAGALIAYDAGGNNPHGN